jgi:hypothetical protein
LASQNKLDFDAQACKASIVSILYSFVQDAFGFVSCKSCCSKPRMPVECGDVGWAGVVIAVVGTTELAYQVLSEPKCFCL